MSTIDNYERDAFTRMLAAGQLPRPESDRDAEALRKVGAGIEGRGVLVQVSLPFGWKATQTENRYGQLIDDKGQVRADFFYKGSPHDTNGHLRMRRRYTTYSKPSDDAGWCAWDRITGTVLFEDSSSSRDEQSSQAKAWLDAHYPDWQDPSQYWNDEDPIREAPSNHRNDRDAPPSRWKFWLR